MYEGHSESNMQKCIDNKKKSLFNILDTNAIF